MWLQVRLEQLAAPEKGAIKIGPFGSQLKKSELVSSGVHVLGIENVLTGCFDGFGDRYITEKKFKPLQSFEVKFGDVLLTMMGTIGEVAIVPKGISPSIMDSHLLRIRPNLKICTSEYIAWLIKGSAATKRAIHGNSHGAIMKGLNSKIVRNLPAPLPTISEQHRIMEMLVHAEALRKKRAEADARAARILPALFYKMFGDPSTNPKMWVQKPFDETFYDCTAQFPKLQRNAYQNVGRFPVIDQGKELIAGYSDDESLVTTVDQPVIVFGDHTRIVKFVDFPFVAGADGSRVFMAKKGFLPAFLAMQLELKPIPNLGYSRHMREVRRLMFIAPPFELQEAYAKRAADVRPLLKSQDFCHSRIESLWQTLLHRAFTGDLTAKWREAHMKELMAEMEQQTKALNMRVEL